MYVKVCGLPAPIYSLRDLHVHIVANAYLLELFCWDACIVMQCWNSQPTSQATTNTAPFSQLHLVVVDTSILYYCSHVATSKYVCINIFHDFWGKNNWSSGTIPDQSVPLAPVKGFAQALVVWNSIVLNLWL